MNFIINFFVAAVLMGTTLMYGTLGEILTEKSGNMNLGVEGLVYMGGSSGLIAAFLYERAAGANAVPMVAVILAFVAAFLAAALGSLLYAFLTITLRTNQNVTGLALTIFGVGYGEFFGEYFRQIGDGRLQISEAAVGIFSQPLLPAFLRNIPVVGKMLFLTMTREGSSGVRDPHSVYPCSSGPAPINMEAQFTALDDGSPVLFFSV